MDEALGEVMAFWEGNQEAIMAFGFAGVCMGIALVANTIINTKSYAWARAKMARAYRRAQLASLTADILTDGLEDAYYKGLISKRERSKLYREFGERGLSDLLLVPKKSKKLHPIRCQKLKEAISARLEGDLLRIVPLPEVRKATDLTGRLDDIFRRPKAA